MTGVLTTAGQILAQTVLYLLFALELCMFARSIMSWLPLDDDNKIEGFLNTITEPFIIPVRALFNKMNWCQDTPMDVPFFVTFLLIIVVEYVLQLFL